MMAITQERIQEIAKLTIGQRDNPLWHEYRKNRFTASQFGKILSAYDSSSEDDWNLDFTKLESELLGNKPVVLVPPMVWGQDHENLAIREYEKKTDTKVEPTGIWIFPNGNFAASPDGIIYNDKDKTKAIGVVEVKCPWRLRKIKIGNVSDWNAHLDYLDHWNKLLPSHPYYHQIQGEMMATKVDWCDFIIWCPSGILISRIFANKGWQEDTIDKLENIYKSSFVRGEDYQYFTYRRNLELMQPILFGHVITPTTKEKQRSYRTFIYALAIHLARWCKKLRIINAEQLPWEQCHEKYIEEARKRICTTCVVKLFMFEWKSRHREEELPEEIMQIRDCKFHLPFTTIAIAAKRALSISIDGFLKWEPCMCVKL